MREACQRTEKLDLHFENTDFLPELLNNMRHWKKKNLKKPILMINITMNICEPRRIVWGKSLYVADIGIA